MHELTTRKPAVVDFRRNLDALILYLLEKKRQTQAGMPGFGQRLVRYSAT